MSELTPSVEALLALHRPLVDPEELGATLHHVVSLVVGAVEPCDLASVTLATDGPATAAFSSDAVEPLDQVQYDAGGPCIDAYEHAAVYLVPDLRGEPRWPEFAATATAHGVFSSQSHPLVVGGRAVGSINLYGHEHGAFDAGTVGVGELFASHAAIALGNAMTAAELRLLADQLRTALVARDVIGQAKGVLMAQRRVTADGAFALLRHASQRQNRKLRDVAADVAATGELPDVP